MYNRDISKCKGNKKMNTLTLILSIEIGAILGLAIAQLVSDIRISNEIKRIAKLQMEIAVNEGLLRAFQNIKLEQEYRDYINGDSGERYRRRTSVTPLGNRTPPPVP